MSLYEAPERLSTLDDLRVAKRHRARVDVEYELQVVTEQRSLTARSDDIEHDRTLTQAQELILSRVKRRSNDLLSIRHALLLALGRYQIV